LQHPAIDLYSMRLSRMGERGLADYAEFRGQFFKQYEKLPEKERDALFACAMNDTVVEFKNGNMEACAEMLLLMDEGIKYGILLQNGILPTTRFVNYVQTATQYGGEKHIEQIIPVLCPLLSPEDLLGRGSNCFQQGALRFEYGYCPAKFQESYD